MPKQENKTLSMSYLKTKGYLDLKNLTAYEETLNTSLKRLKFGEKVWLWQSLGWTDLIMISQINDIASVFIMEQEVTQWTSSTFFPTLTTSNKLFEVIEIKSIIGMIQMESSLSQLDDPRYDRVVFMHIKHGPNFKEFSYDQIYNNFKNAIIVNTLSWNEILVIIPLSGNVMENIIKTTTELMIDSYSVLGGRRHHNKDIYVESNQIDALIKLKLVKSNDVQSKQDFLDLIVPTEIDNSKIYIPDNNLKPYKLYGWYDRAYYITGINYDELFKIIERIRSKKDKIIDTNTEILI